MVRLTLSITPKAKLMTPIDEPPLEIRGSGWPDTGNTPTLMAIWNSAWNVMNDAIPMTSNDGSTRLLRRTIIAARPSKDRYNNITNSPPMSPVSSMIIEKM